MAVLDPAVTAAQTAAGSVTSTQGDCRLKRASATLQPVAGMPVEFGDRLETGANGRVVVTLADQSRLELAESSSITVDQPTRVSLFSGLVHAVVRFAATGGGPTFQVSTPNAVAAVRGTKWDTSYQEGVERPRFAGCKQFTDVTVAEGTVEVSNPTATGAAPLAVTPGHHATVPCALAPLMIGSGILGGILGGTAAEAAAAAAAGAGGVLGGYAGTGGFSGGGGGGGSIGLPASSPRK
ncbi:MAG: FecR family protein [Candidatus Binataceae bacterium]